MIRRGGNQFSLATNAEKRLRVILKREMGSRSNSIQSERDLAIVELAREARLRGKCSTRQARSLTRDLLQRIETRLLLAAQARVEIVERRLNQVGGFQHGGKSLLHRLQL